MYYCIADMILEFRGDPPLEDHKLWELFRTSAPVPSDYIFIRRYVPQLPTSEEGHYFYDAVRRWHYAHSLEKGSVLHLDVLQEALPWGIQIHQLYEELALPHVLLQKQRLLLHASYIQHEGMGILFTAPSGTGKSTQADLWALHRGAEILNGDRAVFGLRGDEPYAFGFPMSGSSSYCVNRSLPLRCIVSLRQAPENRIRLLKGREALRVILNGTYSDPKHPGDFGLNMQTALSLLSTPIFELSCRPDLGAVETLEQAIRTLPPRRYSL